MDGTRFERFYKNTIEIQLEFIPVTVVFKLRCMDRSRFERFFKHTIEIPLEFKKFEKARARNSVVLICLLFVELTQYEDHL